MPKVSVIVPVFNVEPYLEACLDSLVQQTLTDIEVIMVNDGSTDNSPDIMEKYSKLFPNFKSFHKENGGLGQARNFGVTKATGDYIIFLDSDDYVAAHAYELMYETALQTGSDIVVGNVERFNSTKIFKSGLHKKVFSETTLNTHISRYPDLMYDTTAWNKLYKKSFWEHHQFKFPEGILYEDIPVTIPAHFLSHSTDILEDVIYYWREREGNDQSITQKRYEIKNFVDRLTVVRMVDHFLREHHVEEALYDLFIYKSLNVDILLYLNQLDEVNNDYLQVFFTRVGEYLKTIPEKTLDKLNAIDRLKYYFVKENDKERFFQVLTFQKQELGHRKVLKKGKLYIGDFPFRDELPEHLFIMNNELEVIPKINRVYWKNKQLHIVGFNYIKYVDMKSKHKITLEAKLFNPQSEKSIRIPVSVVKRPDVTHKRGVRLQGRPLKRLYNYHWSGYELAINFEDEAIRELGEGRLELWFTLNVNGLERTFRAGGPVSGKKPRPPYHSLDGQRLKVDYNKKWDFYIDVSPILNAIEKVFAEGHQLIIEGWSRYGDEQVSLLLYNYRTRQSYFPLLEFLEQPHTELQDKQGFKAVVDLNELSTMAEEGDWTCYIDYDDAYLPATLHPNIKLDIISFGQQEVRMKPSGVGNLIIDFLPQTPKLCQMRWTETTLHLQLRMAEEAFAQFDHINNAELILQHVESGQNVYSSCTLDEKSKGYWYFSSDISIKRADEDKALLDLGKWNVYLEVKGHLEEGLDESMKRRVFIEEGIQDALIHHSFSRLKHIPYKTSKGNMSIKIILEWPWLERGPRRQEVTRRVFYQLFRYLPMKKKSVVLESYWGRSATCNPRAIVDYMEEHGFKYKFIWTLNNENTPVNSKGMAVRKNSIKYYYYMATAKYFINNANFPDFYKKRKRAVEVQTLHGTFLKTMGLDVPGENETEEKREKFLRRCRRWDYLISPSSYMTEISRRCFLYEKEMLEVGFPRNDVLYRNNHPQFIEQLKDKLNLPRDKKVILYAPTWRVRNKFNIELDIEKMQNELGDDYILLLRLHYFVATNIDISSYEGFAYNMSSYGDIQELYLLSDVLITDYSSVMFDYANLSRPILFFTYDLEYYRDQLRGFYIDLEQEAPGPLVKTNEELIDALQTLDHYHDHYNSKLEAFRDKFCEFDNGNASKQVVEKVFNLK
ncbi:hypothetical protein GCM10011391_38860 [Pullulanibacillus camelliae]|uniref:Glycosyltransferase 2-like domain-containing protein n=1 Tax=Pullulanibacillus camelliae TaxID=1707096 RepID=A0A8J3E144_9BACL|nr:bifunctional glycosyltransferase/CDP-glycerol:glycerophosphate glycerophosphotransferase [Pullulanibacillus camelliae]GGE56077.1 hypothetical protein GCM10011391_38860 [Pullulanibacillus camelliae]